MMNGLHEVCGSWKTRAQLEMTGICNTLFGVEGCVGVLNPCALL